MADQRKESARQPSSKDDYESEGVADLDNELEATRKMKPTNNVVAS